MKKLIAIITVLTLISCALIGVNAKDESLKTEFIEEFNMLNKDIQKLDEDELMSIILQTRANNFSEEQVEALIKSSLSEKHNQEGYEGILSDDGEYYIYGNGVKLPVQYKIHESGIATNRSVEDDENNEFNSTYGYYECTKPSDKTGVYWAVQSNEGYNEATAFVELPTLKNVATRDRAYMFLAANSFAQGNSLAFVGDYGVVYDPQGSQGAGWYPFINASQWSDIEHGYRSIKNMVYDKIPSNVTKVYLHIRVDNKASTDTVYFSCKNGDNFNQVYLEGEAVAFSGNPVQANATNLNLYHETTLAQHSDANVNGNVNTNSGTKILGATFKDAYLYVTTQGTYFKWKENVTKKAYKQAPKKYMLDTVLPTIISKWDSDSVDIIFNVIPS